jgi:hypothetical protein
MMRPPVHLPSPILHSSPFQPPRSSVISLLDKGPSDARLAGAENPVCVSFPRFAPRSVGAWQARSAGGVVVGRLWCVRREEAPLCCV